MADKDDLELVRSGSKELEKTDLRNADLSGGDFFYADLSGAQLNQSRFINANLVASNLKEASIVGADFSGADLRGAKLPRIAVSVKFVRAILRGTRVKLHGQNIDFRGADLIGADFTGSKFGADVDFDGVQVDETSNFDGVEMLQATSRYPAFSAYDYEQGKLVRRNDLYPTLQPTAGTAPIMQEAITKTIVEYEHITTRLKEHPRDLALMAAMLAATVRQELENTQPSRPNEPSALAHFERYMNFLDVLASSLEELSVEIREAASSSQEQGYSKAAQIVEALQKRIEGWCAENAETVTGVKQTGMIGLGVAFLSLCGATPVLATAISAATFGGPMLMKTIKDYFGKSGD